MDIKINNDKSEKFETDYTIIAIDSTGVKVTNRDQWMRDKWKVRKKEYLKIHIAVNIKKKILFMKVTADEQLYDSKALPELVEYISKSKSMTIDKILADGAYVSNDIFKCLADNGIPWIKVRKDVRVGLKTYHILRNLSVISQRNNLQRLKDGIVSYEKR